jgi:hypothetical protein
MAQSGWTRDIGTLFVKLDASHFSSDQYYNPLGNSLITSEFRQTTVNLYGEYGFRDRLTFIVQAPLLRLNSFETTESVIGQGDLRLEAKYRITNNNLPLSISIAPELPTGRANAFASSLEFPEDRINLPTGDGEFNVWATVAVSKSIDDFYLSIFGSYNFRTVYRGEAFRDIYKFGGELGYHILANLWVNSKLHAQFSTGDSRYPSLGFIRGDATTFTLLSFEAYYQITPNWGLSATFLTGSDWIAPFKNIYIAPYFSAGIVYQRQ